VFDFLLGGWRDLIRDTLALIDVLIDSARGLALAAIGLIVSWFLYVPVHELLHVAGCVATGGTVTRLTLAPIYGASLLKRFFPFIEVAAGAAGDRGAAGRLTGFSTNGSDLCYLATDAAPYLLTVIAGVPLMRWCARRGAGRGGRAFLAGPAIVIAMAPLIGITGDYFEMGSIIVTSPLDDRFHELRSDDLVAIVSEMSAGRAPGGGAGHAVVGASLVIGILLAGWTWRLGGLLARVMDRFPGDDAAPPSRGA